MCGIVGAAARREVSEILLEGLRRLEYRGYDSAGLALVDNDGSLLVHKQTGKVAALEVQQAQQPIYGCTGIAHTRWATHGKPSQVNAHPHTADNQLAIVHNGIIENHSALRAELDAADCTPLSETDSELVALLLSRALAQGSDLLGAMQQVVPQLQGAFALAATDARYPDQLVAARRGSPLVIGVGIGENFLASDQLALRQVTDSFIYLEEGDIALLTPASVALFDSDGAAVERPVESLSDVVESADRGQHSHFMYKEIFEQPDAIEATLHAALPADGIDAARLDAAFGAGAATVFPEVKGVQIVACGTSFHAGLVARYWLEEWAGVPCEVEVASEFRYRRRVAHANTLLVTVSQSGETADTLAALRNVKDGEFIASLAIVNTANSALQRESELVFQTRAGVEIGVASTKAFTTQLAAFLLLTLALGRHGRLDHQACLRFADTLREVPGLIRNTLSADAAVRQVSEEFVGRFNSLFLGRGIHYPIALEGALKLKEISYIHAEAYPAGELKHGPLALVDRDMPVVAVAPSNELLEKLKSNLEEVRARGGELYVFADEEAGFESEASVRVIDVPHGPALIMPFIHTVALQLLAYHVADMKGTDVDQPRNLAKSVTVE
ncbi:MAG: glutamine--fructose-6-phosphate transaminase (isomerizing) [Pseudomonadota bacterium]